jgi:hypothetical protein
MLIIIMWFECYYQAMCALGTCCLEVSGLEGAWSECDFTHQEQTYSGGPNNPYPLSQSINWEAGGLCVFSRISFLLLVSIPATQLLQL